MAEEKRAMLADTYYLGYGVAIIVALVALLLAAIPGSFDLGEGQLGAAAWGVRLVGIAILIASLVGLAYLIRTRRPVPRDQMKSGAGAPGEGDEGKR